MSCGLAILQHNLGSHNKDVCFAWELFVVFQIIWMCIMKVLCEHVLNSISGVYLVDLVVLDRINDYKEFYQLCESF
jgi:hypothetical protein